VNILCFNVGSTTLKYACINAQSGERLTEGIFDRIGQTGGDAADHLVAARTTLASHSSIQVGAIAHRVVQGADRFCTPTLVCDQTLRDLATLDDLAPLHNPTARIVIEDLHAGTSPAVQVMVFDSAYYAQLPAKAFRYAVPDDIFRQHHVRRYGAHGTSHQFVTLRCLKWLAENMPNFRRPARVISLHLGGGASVTASMDGVAVETSMGMTPLEGLVMATRSGDIDPAVVFHLARTAGMSLESIDQLLNKQSGLKGLCGDVDMRTVLKRREAGDAAAILAIDVYVHRIHKYIGAYFAILGGLDAIVFTAGVGENSMVIRELICRPLEHLGIRIDDAQNAATSSRRGIRNISGPAGPIRTLIIPTDEEFAIAQQAAQTLNKS